MIRIRDSIAGEKIFFHFVQSTSDVAEFRGWVSQHDVLGIDTESTGLNCYAPQWRLRTVQCGNRTDSYVLPAKWRNTIAWLMRQDIKWIGHNGPHDIRCIDQFLGYETGVVCAGETYIPAHHRDSRGRDEGGYGHGLKELSCAFIDPSAGKWEVELNRVFKTIEIPVPGVVYKSGPRKGQPRMRKARLAEGWGLIALDHPAYIAYAAADPLLTYRLYGLPIIQSQLRQALDLYHFDHEVQVACDRLTRRAIRLDVAYTERLSARFLRKAEQMREVARSYGCENIHSGQQVARTLTQLGIKLRERTPTGQFKTDDRVLRTLLSNVVDERVHEFLHAVLLAKQLLKRRESYTEQMLSERDSKHRIHPSINSLGARTARMSVSRPPLQQLPTKDREEDE